MACAAVGLLAATVFAGVATARSIPAFSGRAANGSELACFNVSPIPLGWVTNNSCGTTIYEIPLHADSNGGKTVNMTVNAPNNVTRCRDIGISRTGTNFTASPFVPPTVFNTPTAIVLSGAVQISMGMIFVDCDVGTGASLIQVDWNN